MSEGSGAVLGEVVLVLGFVDPPVPPELPPEPLAAGRAAVAVRRPRRHRLRSEFSTSRHDPQLGAAAEAVRRQRSKLEATERGSRRRAQQTPPPLPDLFAHATMSDSCSAELDFERVATSGRLAATTDVPVASTTSVPLTSSQDVDDDFRVVVERLQARVENVSAPVPCQPVRRPIRAKPSARVRTSSSDASGSSRSGFVATVREDRIDRRQVRPVRLFRRRQRLLIRGEDRLGIRGGRGSDGGVARQAAGESETQADDEQGRERRRGGGPSKHAATLGHLPHSAGAPSTATSQSRSCATHLKESLPNQDSARISASSATLGRTSHTDSLKWVAQLLDSGGGLLDSGGDAPARGERYAGSS